MQYACRLLYDIYLGALGGLFLFYSISRDVGVCPFGPNENLKISAPGSKLENPLGAPEYILQRDLRAN